MRIHHRGVHRLKVRSLPRGRRRAEFFFWGGLRLIVGKELSTQEFQFSSKSLKDCDTYYDESWYNKVLSSLREFQ